MLISALLRVVVCGACLCLVVCVPIQEYIKVTNFTKPTRDLKKELLNSPFDLSSEQKRMIAQLHDLLSKIFVLDPAQRISVEDALRHEFITSMTSTA